MSRETPAPRNATLDVLRGVAIAMVILFHAFGISPGLGSETLREVMAAGWSGVDLFFVLSGFLIGGLLLREVNGTGTIALGRFWLRRGIKIWPSYYVAFGTMLALRFAHHLYRGAGDTIRAELGFVPRNLFFIQNYFPVETHWPNSWSLAVEEHFYLALPLALLGLVRLCGRARLFHAIVALCCVVAAVALGLRLHASRVPDPDTYFPTHLRADSLVAGVALAAIATFRPRLFAALARRWRLSLVLAPLVVLAMIPLHSRWPRMPFDGDPTWNAFTIGLTLLWLGFVPLVAAAGAYPDAVERAPAPLRPLLGALSWLGRYSYTVYLAQAILPSTPGFPKTVAVVARVVGGPAATTLMFSLASIALGVALSRLVERPLLRRRDSQRPTGVPSVSAAPPAGVVPPL